MEDLVTLYSRLDGAAMLDPATVEAHLPISREVLKRGLDHGHEDDQWSRAASIWRLLNRLALS